MAILQLLHLKLHPQQTVLSFRWGWIPPRSTNQVGREFPHMQAVRECLLSGPPRGFKSSTAASVLCLWILGHGMSGLSHLSSTLGWNTNRGDGLLANTQEEPGGPWAGRTAAAAPWLTKATLIKTDTHQSHQRQELHCKLGLRIWRGVSQAGTGKHREKRRFSQRPGMMEEVLFQEAGCLKCS